MSYDIEICVKIDGLDQYARIAEPEYASPTYNLGKMFRECMKWQYSQGEYYNCAQIISNVEHGIRELRTNKEIYIQYNPANGWGDINSAIRALESLRECIYECAEEIPIDHLYMRW